MVIYYIKTNEFTWDEEKNRKLLRERNVSFPDVLVAIRENRILDIVKHHNEGKYPDQMIIIVEIINYAWLVPFVYTNDNSIFLKTIIPSRKAARKYMRNVK